MLTALDAVDDRVSGLESGADDYLTKPFAFRELLARLKALARRRPAVVPAQHRITDLEVDLSARTVRRAGKPILLTAKEFALLELFVLHQGRALDRTTITAHVWDDNHDPFANVLDVLVRRLRRKIDDGFEPKRSEEHTSELQSQSNLVCRLLLEKKKNRTLRPHTSR